MSIAQTRGSGLALVAATCGSNRDNPVSSLKCHSANSPSPSNGGGGRNTSTKLTGPRYVPTEAHLPISWPVLSRPALTKRPQSPPDSALWGRDVAATKNHGRVARHGGVPLEVSVGVVPERYRTPWSSSSGRPSAHPEQFSPALRCPQSSGQLRSVMVNTLTGVETRLAKARNRSGRNSTSLPRDLAALEASCPDF